MPTAERERYVPSGRVDWPNFLPLALIATAIGFLLGFALHVLHLRGAYLPLVLPLLAAATGGCVVRLALSWGDCRSPLAATLLAVLVGLAIMPGAYYIDMLAQRGVANALRPDVFADFVQFRWQTDLWRNPQDNPPKPRPIFALSVACFIAETLLVLVLVRETAKSVPRRPYCESGRTWMSKQAVAFPPGHVTHIAAALADGKLENLAEVTPWRHCGVPRGQLTVHYGRSDDGRLTGPVYAEGAELVYFSNDRPDDWGTRVLPLSRLSQDEFIAVGPYMPALAMLLAPPPDVDSTPPGRTKVADLDGFWITLLSDPPAWKSSTIAARVVRLNSGLIVLLLGLALGVFGAISDNVAYIFAGYFVTCCGFAAWAAVLMAGGSPRWPVVRDKVLTRADFLVDPDADDSFTVEYVPREHWMGFRLDDVADVGFARIDFELGRLLFEGDLSRWSIPAESILRCEVESVDHVLNSEPFSLRRRDPFVARLLIQRGEGFRELPLRIVSRPGAGAINDPLDRTEQFVERVVALVERAHASAD